MLVAGHAPEITVTRGRDDDYFALYVDMLGFSALIEKHPQSEIETLFPTSRGVSTTPSGDMFNRFHNLLEHFATADQDTGPQHVMIFSDSAFLMYQDGFLAASAAAKMMRALIASEVPARMGLAHGTCGLHRFTYDTNRSLTLARAMFSGTAVTKSAGASDKSGAKGLRILIDDSFMKEGQPPPLRSVACKTTSERVSHELDYLTIEPGENRPAHLQPDELRLRVLAMRDGSPPDGKVELHYIETFAAFDRMRDVAAVRPMLSTLEARPRRAEGAET